MIETYGLTHIALASLRLRKYKPAEQADSKSIIRRPESDHEIHGEVGLPYGAGASRHRALKRRAGLKLQN